MPPSSRKSSQPTWEDVERLTALVSDLHDLPSATGAREHLVLERLRELVGAPYAALVRHELRPAPEAGVEIHSMQQVGLGQRQLDLLDGYLLEHGDDDPLIPIQMDRLRGSDLGAQRSHVYLRQQVLADKAFYTHPHAELRHELDFDNCVQAHFRYDSTRTTTISLHRPNGERPFDERARRLLDLINAHAGRVISWSALPLGGIMRLQGRMVEVPLGTGSAELYGLTPRERQTAELVRVGLANKEIARELGISANTVKAHLKALSRKTGCMSRTELAVLFTHLPLDGRH
ncbi:MAG: helix-turn-helix transcriptional regulator [Planctomycetota bacterium]